MHGAKPKKYHDIVLAGGLNKDYISEKETFEEIYAKSSSIGKLMHSQATPSSNNYTPAELNYLNAKVYSFEDSDNIRFRSLDLEYERAKVSKNISLAADIGMMSIENTQGNKYNGKRYGATLLYNHLSMRLGLNDFDDFLEVVPTLRYEDSYRKHNYMFEYTRQNALFYTYSLPSYEKRITADHFALSDYKSYNDKTDIWASLESNRYSNTDVEVTGQFDWRFFYDTFLRDDFSYHVALEGWYTSHTKVNSDFYSPNFADSTMIRIDPKYTFTKYLSLLGKFGVGYSVKDKDTPYKYGLWIQATPQNSLSYKLGCLFSNAARLSNGPSYHYRECEANLGYAW